MNLQKHTAVRSLAVALGLVGSLGAADAAIVITTGGQGYTQNFNSLTTSTSSQTWVNDSTLAGWSLFRQPAPGTAITGYAGSDGSNNAGAFNSFGAAAASDRALGGVGSGGAYFGSPAAGSIAGWIAAAFTNTSGQTLSGFTLSFDGEQWRNGGNTSAQTMVFEYGFGSSFTTVTDWATPGGLFNWASTVNTSTAGTVNGNTTGLVASRGGTVASPWDADDTLWVRWTERNDAGNDHGLAIDNLSFIAGQVVPVPEPSSLALMGIGLAALGAAARRRARGA